MRTLPSLSFVTLAVLCACSASSGGKGFDPSAEEGAGGSGQGGDDPGFTSGSGGSEEHVCLGPEAMDYPGNGVDEDCNGTADDAPANCDATLPLASADAMDGARAIGLCQVASKGSWGVVSAEWVTADGQLLAVHDPAGLGHGILPSFGPNVNAQEGARMLVLSSGTARQPTDPGYASVGGFDKGYMTGSPPGYPKESPACGPEVITGEPHDSAGLRVRIKTPTNSKSFSFNLDFYTYEFPVFTCSTFNDFFVAMLDPKPVGQPDGNISFDSQGNTISVNASFLEVCHAQDAGGKHFPCTLGPEQLAGTGFDVNTNSAATSWLQTTAPIVAPGEDITLLFAIWDSGDGILDSTVLIDNFTFQVGEAPTETEPVPVPK